MESLRSKRVLMVSPSLLNLDNGSSVRVRSEIDAITGSGVRLSLSTYKVGTPTRSSRTCTIPLLPGFVKPGPTFHRLYLDPQLACASLFLSLVERPHLIHAHLNEGSLAAGPAKKVMGIPLVMDLQGSLVSEVNFSGLVGTNEFLFSAFKFVEVLSQNLADHIIVSSPILKRTVQRFVPSRIITVVPDCVQSSLFSPRKKSFALMQALAIPRNRFIIVYLGSLSKVQGIDLLLGAAKIALQENHDLHFVVMGFPNEASYRFMADSLEISDRVTFTGGVPLGLVPQYLAMGDLAISPKRESSESNGN